jgi:hypothetical protein
VFEKNLSDCGLVVEQGPRFAVDELNAKIYAKSIESFLRILFQALSIEANISFRNL